MIDFRLQDAALDFFSDNELPSCMYNVDGTSLLYIVSLATYTPHRFIHLPCTSWVGIYCVQKLKRPVQYLESWTSPITFS